MDTRFLNLNCLIGRRLVVLLYSPLLPLLLLQLLLLLLMVLLLPLLFLITTHEINHLNLLRMW